MSKKIFNSIWVVALAVFLASLLFIMGMSYSYFSDVQEAQLRIETELAAKGTAMGGTDYLEGLGQKNYRITWIDSDGTVLYDSQADSAGMENHLEREEVRQALETGHGESSRYSKTLSEELLYCAELLPDVHADPRQKPCSLALSSWCAQPFLAMADSLQPLSGRQ